MTDPYRTRGTEGTLHVRAYRLLRDVGSMTVYALADRLGRHVDSCRRACRDLERRRFAEGRRVPLAGARGAPFATFYVALPRQGEPRDLRGTRAGSHGNVRGATAWAGWVRMMQRKHGPSWRPRPRAVIALEEAWPTWGTR